MGPESFKPLLDVTFITEHKDSCPKQSIVQKVDDLLCELDAKEDMDGYKNQYIVKLAVYRDNN